MDVLLRMGRIIKILERIFIYLLCLSVLSGCVYNDEPMPKIVGEATSVNEVFSPKIIPGIETGYFGEISASWIPPKNLEAKRQWQGIIIHHSGTRYGCAAHEHKYHKSIGWDGLGYHFIINNGVYENGYGKPDGLVEVGYRWREQQDGSHCRPSGDLSNYWNKHTIGICLIGDFEQNRPTERQWRSLVKLIRFLQQRYNIQTYQIKGHRDVKPTKCPGRYFSFDELRRRLAK